MLVCTRLKQWLYIISAACGTYNNACVNIMLERQIYYLNIEEISVSSDVLYSQVFKKKNIYIPLSNLNFDDPSLLL
jgi:hypothetical protein